jgi:hypothetical protein
MNSSALFYETAQERLKSARVARMSGVVLLLVFQMALQGADESGKIVPVDDDEMIVVGRLVGGLPDHRVAARVLIDGYGALLLDGEIVFQFVPAKFVGHS